MATADDKFVNIFIC